MNMQRSIMMNKLGKRILGITIVLTIIGIYQVYSSSRVWALYKENDSYYYLKRQILFMIIGYIALIILSKINLNKIFGWNKKLLLISFIMLVLVLVPGLSIVRNGSRSWFGIGSFAFQPSEFAKFSLIVFSSVYLANNYNKSDHFFKTTFIVLLIGAILFGLIMLQPDLGTGLVIMSTLIVMTFASRSKIKHYLLLGSLALLAFVALIISEPYRLERITAYLDPFSDPLGSGFQIIQSIYALSPGGLIGEGIDGSIQKHFYLPEPQTDFIFAIFCEEWGFIGGIFLLILFGYFINTGLKIARSSNDLKRNYLALGIVSVISIQVIINLAVVVGLIPVTGITLPFISYGGSSLVVTLALTGLLINVSKGEKKNESDVNSRR